MYDIKELTLEKHKNAERRPFAVTLMSGKINPKLFATYLYNQLQCYSVLEKYGIENSLFKQTPNLPRAEALYYDYTKIWIRLGNPPKWKLPTKSPSTIKYIEHIESIKEDAEKLYAHIYVRYLADMAGGQMIKKHTPGSNRYYTFKHGEIKEYSRIVKETVNSYLNVYKINVLAEAEKCYDFATDLFEEMSALEKTDYPQVHPDKVDVSGMYDPDTYEHPGPDPDLAKAGIPDWMK